MISTRQLRLMGDNTLATLLIAPNYVMMSVIELRGDGQVLGSARMDVLDLGDLPVSLVSARRIAVGMETLVSLLEGRRLLYM